MKHEGSKRAPVRSVPCQNEIESSKVYQPINYDWIDIRLQQEILKYCSTANRIISSNFISFLKAKYWIA